MSKIAGGYPGGPPHHDPQAQGADSRGPELRGGETVEASVVRHATGRTKKLRKRRLLIGLVTFLVVGVGMGAYIGLQSRKTAEELAEQEAEGSEVDIKKEADRLLNELWRMEDLERAPRL